MMGSGLLNSGDKGDHRGCSQDPTETRVEPDRAEPSLSPIDFPSSCTRTPYSVCTPTSNVPQARASPPSSSPRTVLFTPNMMLKPLSYRAWHGPSRANGTRSRATRTPKEDGSKMG
ncbi:hypothetical protein VTO42DRAFT_2109 [Malbranchea cinnamomea]